LGEDGTTPLLLDVESNFQESGGRAINLGFISGVIPRSRINTFERVLWRALRGNLYMNQAEIKEAVVDPNTDENIEKNVFVIFSHGQEVLNKARKIAESLGATLYSIDDHPDARHTAMSQVSNRINDLTSVLYNTNHARRAELIRISEDVLMWMAIVKKEKAIYHTMNLFNYDNTRRCLIAEGWTPTNSIDQVQTTLRQAGESENMQGSLLHEVKTKRTPPTFHRTDRFTSGFQAIVDSYGVAKYGEVNPGLFTIISFPFLFAVMFGDIGHGFITFLVALYLVLNETRLAKTKGSEFFNMLFGGRYIVLLMGLFAIYTGLIYNDIFSRSIDIFGSGWRFDSHEGIAIGKQTGVYPIGIDPAWHGSENALIFTNSYKMKMSILFGVIQMTFGIFLNYFNFTHFNEGYSIYLELIPQLVFMLGIFGYLSITIIYKWCVDWSQPNAGSPPGLLNMLIYMFLAPGSVKPEDTLYSGQAVVQTILLIAALICVPIMLFGKPVYLYLEHKRTTAVGYSTLPGGHTTNEENTDGSEAVPVVEDEDEHDDGHGHGGEFDFGEIMIHQAIHTIEFCLGCISNTASYLRLWALSLAHAQLSIVLWDMTLKPFFGLQGATYYIVMPLAIAFWFIATCAILIGMEGLSAFLHALRLHWVEFNSKFYDGKGRPFEPFEFSKVLAEEES
jgi:V-type H+-transporting ATPase subunit a